MIRSIWNGPCARGGYWFQTGSDGASPSEISQPLQHLHWDWRNSAATGLGGNYPLTNYFKDIESLALELRFNWSLPAIIITFMINCNLYSHLLKPLKIEQFRKEHLSCWALRVFQALFTYSSSEQQRNLGTEILTHFWSLGINHDYLFLMKYQNVPASKCCHGNHYTQNLAWLTRKIKSDQIKVGTLCKPTDPQWSFYPFLSLSLTLAARAVKQLGWHGKGYEIEREFIIALIH